MTAARGFRAFGWRWRALTPDQEAAIAAAHAAGAEPKALADAYCVHVRTIWRAISRASRERHDVVIGEMRATFELEDGVPVQVTPWVPV